MTNQKMSRVGHCIRCGTRYVTPTKPGCECAGEPPINPHTRRILTTLHPTGAAYYERVRRLRSIGDTND